MQKDVWGISNERKNYLLIFIMWVSKQKKILNFDIQNNSASEEEIAKDENVEAGQGDQGDDG